MKTALLAGTLLFAAPFAPSGGTATGTGSMSFGHEDLGRAWFRFSVQDGDEPSGTVTFAAEHHHDDERRPAMFPDIVVTLGTIDELQFGAASVEFSGPGKLHDDPVTVVVEAYDKGKKADRFVLKCKNGKGRVVFEADGTLFRGDITIPSGGGR